MNKKIIITVGGTGGHVFPAISLGKQLQQIDASIDLRYVGGNLASNPYFEHESFKHYSIDCATFKKKHPWALFKSTSKILLGIIQSHKIVKDYDPDLVVGFGSYYTLPILLAAKMKGIPFILHEANSIPGKVNRLLSKYAAMTGLHFPETASLLKGKTCEVGLPLRPGYHQGACSVHQAREYFNLDADCHTILVFGGSQGARNLNHIVCQALTNNSFPKWQILHFTGDEEVSKTLSHEYKKSGIRACVKSFETRMDLAWQAADISIARAGAGTIAEQMEFEVPGILIPYPYATDNHQDKNADFLVNVVGGAVKFAEKDLTPSLLASELASFSKEKRERMSKAMKYYKIKNRAKDLCGLVLDEIKT